MARIIGIDYGTRHIGIAVTDPLQLIASPLTTLRPQQVLPFLQEYTQKELVETIVVGLPLQLSGTRGAMVRLVARFTRFLQRYFPTILVTQHDERYTSVMAETALLAANFKRKDRRDKNRLNQTSATLILRSFMERPRAAKEPVAGPPVPS